MADTATGRKLKRMSQTADPLGAFATLPREEREAIAAELTSVAIADALGIPRKDRAIRRLSRTPNLNLGKVAEKVSTAQSDLAAELLALLQKSRDTRWTYGHLSEKFDRSTSSIRVAVQQLADEGYHVSDHIDCVILPLAAVPQVVSEPIDFRGTECIFGVVSDTHLGSLHAATDMLESAYDLFAAEGVEHVMHCGDLTEGPGNRGYRGHQNDVRDDCQDIKGLERFVSASYPFRRGIVTHCISSSKSHDGWEWNASGRCPTADVCNGRGGYDPLPAREDMRFEGHDQADILLGSTKVRLFHPDGGCAYADSYKLQKFVEAMPGGTKPDVFLCGHYHTNCHTDPRNVWAFAVPGMQWQSPFFRRFGKEPKVGAILMRLRLDAEGSLRNVIPEYLKHYVRS